MKSTRFHPEIARFHMNMKSDLPDFMPNEPRSHGSIFNNIKDIIEITLLGSMSQFFYGMYMFLL